MERLVVYSLKGKYRVYSGKLLVALSKFLLMTEMTNSVCCVTERNILILFNHRRWCRFSKYLEAFFGN